MIDTYDDLLHQLAKEHEKVRRRMIRLEFTLGEDIGCRDALRAQKRPTDKIEKRIADNQLVLLELTKLAAFHNKTAKRIRELIAEDSPLPETRCQA